MAMVALRLDALTKQFPRGLWRGTTLAVDRLSLDVQAGEVVGLVGPNGAGKTTTLRIVLGLVRPTSGAAWIFDQPVSDYRARRRVGYLPESAHVHGYLTAQESVAFCGRLCGMSGPRLAARVEELLTLVGLPHARHDRLRGFSKGMLQRVGIAQALVNDPDLIFLDEPMSGLDPIGRRDMRRIVQQLQRAGKTVVMSSHLLHDVEALCDRVAILDHGRLVQLVDVHALRDEAAVGETVEVSPLEAIYEQAIGEREARVACLRS